MAFCLVNKHIITIDLGSKKQTFTVDGGVVEVVKNKVLVLAEVILEK